MKVIALMGDENSGKSHTINIVYQFILKLGYQQIPGNFRELGNLKNEDCFDVLENLHAINNSKRIGIIGMGDYVQGANSVRSLLEEMNQLSCDTAICPIRNTERMKSFIEAYKDHHIIFKTITNAREQYRIVNFNDADQIIQLL